MASLLTTAQVATILKISPQRVRQLRTAGSLSGIRVGPIWLYSSADIEAFAAKDRPWHRPKSKAEKE